jgi:MoaA/NifB/PqqE/SkfB family radical SAM enzyme
MSGCSPNGPDAELRAPGFWESVREAFFGLRRPIDCLQVEVTTRCPGSCRYCPRTVLRDQWRSRDMTLVTFSRLWPLMRRASRVHLQGWGEPLLHPDFFQMAALARRAGCQVSTTTCGLRMEAPLARAVVESGIDIVAFSLAGADAPANDAWRRGVAFQHVCQALESLQTVRRKHMAVHLELHIAYLLLASELRSVHRLPALMERLGVHAAVVSTLDYLPAPGLAAEAIGPHQGDLLARAAKILAATAAEARRLGLQFHYALPDPAAAGTGCRENIGRSLFVAADGALSPCVFVNLPLERPPASRRVFGDANREDPLDVWESPAFRRFRRRLTEGDPDLPCLACSKRFMA